MTPEVDRPLPDLAVVVLSVGAPAELRTAVESLQRQSVLLEIVVINSGGGEPRDVLPDSGRGVNIISVPERLWPGAARNLGIRSTRAPYVAFLASDLIAEPDWAANRILLHRQGRKSVASAVVNSHPRNLYAWASHISNFVQRLPKVPRRSAIRYGASYSRSLFDSYGVFREDLRIGEDTEFHRRLARPDRPVWTSSVRAVHRNPTTLKAMIEDQFVRGRREGRHWTQSGKRLFLRRVTTRFIFNSLLSIRSARGLDCLFVVASWPLVLLCTIVRERGVDEGQRQRTSFGPRQQVAVVAILDRDTWTANTDIIVVVDAASKRLVWIPRDLWVVSLNDRINAAFASGGGALLLTALSELGIQADGVLCFRRAASEATLSELTVKVPVFEPLHFWYPLNPTLPIEDGRKRVSFLPPEETLSGERIHQWIGARTMIGKNGSDLLRLQRQQIFMRALLASGFDFQRALENPEWISTAGQNGLAVLSQIRSDWSMDILGPLQSVTIDGKAVLLQPKQ